MANDVQLLNNPGTITSVGPVGQQQPVIPQASSPKPSPTYAADPAQTGSLDPQIVNLVKAIRKTESNGNYQAKGKSGEYGAYQFTDGTWAAAAQKYLGKSVPLEESTPEEQNEVVYKRIADWKAKGFNVGQIASMWNAGEGEPDAYTGKFSNGAPSTGTNKYGANYSVPSYAQKVATAYQQFKANSPSYNPQPFSNPAGNPDGQEIIPPPAPEPTAPNGVNNGKGVGGLLTNLFKPELTGIASGIRAVQSAPSIVKEGIALAKGDKAGAAANDQAANATMNKPLLGVNTLGGNSIKQNLGLAVQTAGQAAGTGALAIGAQTAGNDISNNTNLKKTITDTVIAVVGAKALNMFAPYLGKFAGVAFDALPEAVQASISALGEGASALWDKAAQAVNPVLDKAGAAVPDFMSKSVGENAGGLLGKLSGGASDTYSSALRDVTPDYDSATPAQREKIAAQTAAGGKPRVSPGGILSGSTLNPTQEELDSAEVLSKVPGYDASKYADANANQQAVQKEVANEADTLYNKVKAKGILRSPNQIKSVITNALSDASDNSLLLQKSDPLIDNYMRVAKNAIDQNDGTLAGELKVRHALDNAFENAKGGSAWNSDKVSALKDLHFAVRNALNQDIASSMGEDTDVLASLKKQSALYDASESLGKKAARQPGSLVGRVAEHHPLITKAIQMGTKTALEGTVIGKAIEFLK